MKPSRWRRCHRPCNPWQWWRARRWSRRAASRRRRYLCLTPPRARYSAALYPSGTPSSGTRSSSACPALPALPAPPTRSPSGKVIPSDLWVFGLLFSIIVILFVFSFTALLLLYNKKMRSICVWRECKWSYTSSSVKFMLISFYKDIIMSKQ